MIMIIIIILVLCLLYIYGFIFMHGSSSGKNKYQDNFIHTTCGRNGILPTILTWGYMKATWRRFFIFYKLILFPQPQAKYGGKAIDSKLVSMEGKSLSLLNDYILKLPKEKPLILNMGSFT